MKKRIDILRTDPAAYKAMLALENYIKTSKLSLIHKELIKIRASQINGCAFCIDMHTKEARQIGETEQRIYLLNAWRETDLISICYLPFFIKPALSIQAIFSCFSITP